MHSILHIAIKDLKLLTRDWLGMFFIAGFPVCMGVLFGLMGGSFNTDSASLTIAIVDEDNSTMSKKFIESVKRQGSVTVQNREREEAFNLVRKGNLVGVIVLPPKFGETAGIFWEEQPKIALGVDPSRQAEAGMLQGFVMQAMGELIGARIQDPVGFRPNLHKAMDQFANDQDIPAPYRNLMAPMFQTIDALLAKVEEDRQTEQSLNEGTKGFIGLKFANIEKVDVTRDIDPNSIEGTLKHVRSAWDISFPQAIAWGILGSVAGFAISIVREREKGTLVRLHIAPISRQQILLGKSLACFLTVIAVIVALVALGIALGMRPRSYPLLALASGAIGCCFVGITMLMAVIGKTEEAVSGAAWGANVLMSMFGGGMIPLAFMPKFMQMISHLSPVKWAILSLEGAIWRGFTLGEMIVPCTVLVSVGAVAGWIGVQILSRRDGV